MPRIHNMSQVDSIFIFCGDRKYHEQRAEDWSKIKGVFTAIKLTCGALKQAAQQCEQNAISISILQNRSLTVANILTNNEGELKNVDKLERKYRNQTLI